MQHGRTDGRMMDDGDDGVDDLLCYTLDTGVKIPKLGMWDAITRAVSRDIDKALQSGYRHIVLSPKPDRDHDIRETLTRWTQKPKSGRNRNQLFISLMFELGPTSGLSNIGQHIKHRLQSLECQYIDMIILDKTDKFKLGDNLRQRNTVTRIWKGLEKLVSEKLVRCLSLSNFRQEEIESISASCSTQPDALWLCKEPTTLGWHNLDHVRRYCQYKGITMGVLHRVDRPETEWVRRHGTALGTVSKKHSRTSIQVFHRMLVQKNILVAIATENRSIEASYKVFDFYLDHDDENELEKVIL